MINTATSLCLFLKGFLREKTTNLRVGEHSISPNVFFGKLPRYEAVFEVDPDQPEMVPSFDDNHQVPEITEDHTLFPYILIRPTDLTDEEREDSNYELSTHVILTITVGSYSTHENGFLDVLHIVDVIRLVLLEQVYFGNAELLRPMNVIYPSFEDFDTQNHYFGTLVMTFAMPTIERRLNLDF